MGEKLKPSLSQNLLFFVVNDDENDFEISELKNHVGTQTRIRMRTMKMMISLVDVYEGCSVMIMWDSRHNSYIVFTYVFFLNLNNICNYVLAPEPNCILLRKVV